MKYEEKSYKQKVSHEFKLSNETLFEKNELIHSSLGVVWSNLSPSLKGIQTFNLVDFTCFEHENINLEKDCKSTEKLSETTESFKQTSNFGNKDNSLTVNNLNNNNDKLPSKREDKNIDLPVREENLFKRIDEYRNKIHKITSTTTDREDTNLQSSKLNTSIKAINRSFTPVCEMDNENLFNKYKTNKDIGIIDKIRNLNLLDNLFTKKERSSVNNNNSFQNIKDKNIQKDCTNFNSQKAHRTPDIRSCMNRKNDFEGLKNIIYRNNVKYEPLNKKFNKEISNDYIKCKNKFDSLKLCGRSKKEKVIYPANCMKREDDKTNRVELNNSLLNQSNIYELTKEGILKIEKFKINNNHLKKSPLNTNSKDNNFTKQEELDFFEMYKNLENNDKKFSVLSDKINKISRYENVDQKAILSYLNRENPNNFSNNNLSEKRINRKNEDFTRRTYNEKPIASTLKEVNRKAPDEDNKNLEKFKLRETNIYDYHMKFKELENKLDNLTRKQDKFLI